MSDSARPHRQPPTGPLCPWDSPGKNTGVGCHFLLQCMKVKSESEVAHLCPTLSNPMDCSLPAPPSMGFSRQEYWSGAPLPSPFTTLQPYKEGTEKRYTLQTSNSNTHTRLELLSYKQAVGKAQRWLPRSH